MTSEQLGQLKTLVRIPSPSGFESKIAEYIRQELCSVVSSSNITVDFQNNVACVIEGTSDHVVMIDAHLDQVGFIVNNIDNHGQISLAYIGGGDTTILSARHLVILTEKGPVNAVVNRKASHLVLDEADEDILQIHDALVDIGIRGKAKVESVVRVGDPVVYCPVFEQLRGKFYTGCGLDDKVGCYVLIETIRKIVRTKRKPIPTLVFTFSAQEETWGRKCRPLVKKYNPDLAIEVDVTFATDWDEVSWEVERQSGACRLGDGPVLYRGVDIDQGTLKLMESVAKSHKIKHQCQASTGQIGYTVTEISHEANGIRALILGLPLRNMHTPVEVVNLTDLDLSVRLLTEFLTHRKLGDLLKR